ncbi:MAG: DUF188 domain-containing protein [Oscillospiraceae bacterium]|jgi:uncharacterized protein YaiI (UPF0178 family)|nr:DUF188 domain-containing protein [Oscillospiraceae bacterium]
MRLIIDGDSFPFINEAVKIAVSRNTEYIIFANKQRRPIKKYEHAWITVPNFYGSADLAILESLRDDDVVVTDDRALAAECADKGATVMRSHGGNFDKKHSTKEYARLRKMSAAERDGVLAVKKRLLTLRLESALDGSGDDAAAERERRSLFAKLNGLYTARLLPGARIRAVTRGLPPARSFGGSSARDKRFVRARRRRNKAFRRRSAGVFYIRGKRYYGAGKRGSAERRRLRERAAHELDAAEAQKLLAALELSRVKVRRKAREAAERQNREAAEIERLGAKKNTELTQAERERLDAFHKEKTAALEHEKLAAEHSSERVRLARGIETLAAKKLSLLVEDKRASDEAARREAERLKKLSEKARNAEAAARQATAKFNRHSTADKRSAAENSDRAAAKLESRAKAKLETAAVREREITENGELYLLTRALDDKRFEAIKASIRESRRAAEELKARAAAQRVSADYNRSLIRYYDELFAKRVEAVAAAADKVLAAESAESDFAALRQKTAAEQRESIVAQNLAHQKAKRERIEAEYRHAAGLEPAPARIYPATARSSEAAAKYAEIIYGPEPDDELIPDEIYAEFDIRAEEDSNRSAEPETDWHKKLRALRDEWFQAPETKVQITETKLQSPEAAAQAEPEEPPAPPPQAPGRAKLAKLLRLLYDSVRDIAAAVRSK